MTKEDILNFLKANKELLTNRYKVKEIGLFGSFSKGLQNRDSDIDIIVDMPSNFDLYYDLKDFLESNFKRPVDLGLKESIRLFIKDKIKKDIIYV